MTSTFPPMRDGEFLIVRAMHINISNVMQRGFLYKPPITGHPAEEVLQALHCQHGYIISLIEMMDNLIKCPAR
jgi:hypothetical protein